MRAIVSCLDIFDEDDIVEGVAAVDVVDVELSIEDIVLEMVKYPVLLADFGFINDDLFFECWF